MNLHKELQAAQATVTARENVPSTLTRRGWKRRPAPKASVLNDALARVLQAKERAK